MTQTLAAASCRDDSEAPLRRRRRPDATKVAQAQNSRGSSGAPQTLCEPLSRLRDDPACRSAALRAVQPSGIGARLVRWKRMVREPGARRCLTFELSGPEPGWRLAREADDGPQRFAGQLPSRWRSASSEGLGRTLPVELSFGVGSAEQHAPTFLSANQVVGCVELPRRVAARPIDLPAQVRDGEVLALLQEGARLELCCCVASITVQRAQGNHVVANGLELRPMRVVAILRNTARH